MAELLINITAWILGIFAGIAYGYVFIGLIIAIIKRFLVSAFNCNFKI